MSLGEESKFLSEQVDEQKSIGEDLTHHEILPGSAVVVRSFYYFSCLLEISFLQERDDQLFPLYLSLMLSYTSLRGLNEEGRGLVITSMAADIDNGIRTLFNSFPEYYNLKLVMTMSLIYFINLKILAGSDVEREQIEPLTPHEFGFFVSLSFSGEEGPIGHTGDNEEERNAI